MPGPEGYEGHEGYEGLEAVARAHLHRGRPAQAAAALQEAPSCSLVITPSPLLGATQHRLQPRVLGSASHGLEAATLCVQAAAARQQPPHPAPAQAGGRQRSSGRRHPNPNPSPDPNPNPNPNSNPNQVGDDIADIPAVLRTQMRDWDDPVHSYNRMTAWAFASRLQARRGSAACACTYHASTMHIPCRVHAACTYHAYTMHIPCIYHAYTMHIPCMHIPCMHIPCCRRGSGALTARWTCSSRGARCRCG